MRRSQTSGTRGGHAASHGSPRASTIEAPRDWSGLLLLVLVGLALVLGGASAPASLAGFALQFVAAGMLVAGVLLARRGRVPLPRAAAWLGVAVLAALAVQLLPLPHGLWADLPGRALARETLARAGLAPSLMPFSLDAPASVRAMLAAVPVAAVLALAAGQRALRPRGVATLVVLIALLSWGLGVIQALGSRESMLFFHARTNWGSAVGFFANANHFASLLVACVPLIAVLAALVAAERSLSRLWPLGLVAGFAGIAALGASLAGSVGAIVLLPFAVVASVFLLPRQSARARMGALGVAVGVASAATVLSIGVLGTSFDEGDLSRAQIWRTTMKGVGDFWPIGSGLGTFPGIYPLYEDPAAVTGTFANHAHNDYLELVLELGVMGVLLIALTLGLYAVLTLRAWRAPASEASLWPRAASVVLGVLLAHSVGDYPLRTPALMVLAAYFALVLCMRPAGPERAAPGGDAGAGTGGNGSER